MGDVGQVADGLRERGEGIADLLHMQDACADDGVVLGLCLAERACLLDLLHLEYLQSDGKSGTGIR